jgi:hypothetical protein
MISVGSDDLPFSRPRGLAVHHGGHYLFVADEVSYLVHVLTTSTGEWIGSFGDSGSPFLGGFLEPSFVAIDEGFAYVSDAVRNDVQRFELPNEESSTSRPTNDDDDDDEEEGESPLDDNAEDQPMTDLTSASTCRILCNPKTVLWSIVLVAAAELLV